MKEAPWVSFVIPTYNRATLVCQAVGSALAWMGDAGDTEIVVVDDCSTDSTVKDLERTFAPQIATDVLRLVRQDRNGGVIRAKNAGAMAARGQWLAFLDSDDEMVAQVAPAMREALECFADAPLLFFRCAEFRSGDLLGPAQATPTRLSLRAYLNGPGFGECLPVVRRDAAMLFPYDERLNGWEGLAYARMLRRLGDLVVLPVVARLYRVEGEDRLSSAAGMRRRWRSLARGHWLLLKEFAPFFSPHRLIRQLAKVAVYGLRGLR
jgi:glycosyltransferase involved in cell wall biosynthesis